MILLILKALYIAQTQPVLAVWLGSLKYVAGCWDKKIALNGTVIPGSNNANVNNLSLKDFIRAIK